jgi:hypothetical protein
MKFRVLAASAIAGCIIPTAFAQISAKEAPQSKPVVHKAHVAPVTRNNGSSIPLVGGSDSCATPDVISGTGTFSFDNSAATTGAEGQANAACNFFGTMGIDNDVWFTWTAPSSGNAQLQLCGGSTMDSKVAIYTGSGCPGGAAIACNDDSCSVQSVVGWPATNGTTYTIQLGNYPGATGQAGTFTLNVSQPAGNDDCSAPVAIAGTGSFPFDNSLATTGSQGQGEAACNFFGTTGISNDVWFTWTSNGNGNAVVQLCGGASMDSKLAIYNGAGCPSSAAIACNDDSCGLQSSVTFAATNGGVYTIQLGNYPGATGQAGTFTINIQQPLGPCDPIDDGVSDNAIGLTAGGDQMWLQRFGAPSVTTTVTEIKTAWGSHINSPTQNPPNGSPVDILMYQDPNQDSNPTDGVVLQHLTGTLAGTGTDAFQTFTLSPPVTVTGIFFVGAAVTATAGQFPAPLDQPKNSGAAAQHSWIVGNTTGPLNFTNLSANNVAPLELSAIGFPGQWLLRVTCGGGGGSIATICIPHSAGVISCPCSNPGNGTSGCNNSDNTGGAVLSAIGSPSLASDTVVFSTVGEKSAALSIVVQGDAVNGGVAFGQGVLCAAGNLLRLYVKTASAGSITAPQGGDPTVSAASAAHGDTLSAGAIRYYQVYYRDPTVLNGCPATSTFNASEGKAVTWGP